MKKNKYINFFTLVTSLVFILICTSCGKSVKELNCQAMVGTWMEFNPTVHIRKWETTFYKSGTVDPKKAGIIESNRLAASMACFKLIVHFDSEVNESELEICSHKVDLPGGGANIGSGNKKIQLEYLEEIDFKD